MHAVTASVLAGRVRACGRTHSEARRHTREPNSMGGTHTQEEATKTDTTQPHTRTQIKARKLADLAAAGVPPKYQAELERLKVADNKK